MGDISHSDYHTRRMSSLWKLSKHTGREISSNGNRNSTVVSLRKSCFILAKNKYKVILAKKLILGLSHTVSGSHGTRTQGLLLNECGCSRVRKMSVKGCVAHPKHQIRRLHLPASCFQSLCPCPFYVASI